MTGDGAAAVSGRWTRPERLRLSGIVGVIAALHVAGWSLYLCCTSRLTSATSFAGAGTLAYALGARHAFDADHIAAIDDATRLMLARGRRPLGAGFFFAMGHSAVVLALSLLVVGLAGGTTPAAAGVRTLRAYGPVAAALAAAGFLLLVAALNAAVLTGMIRLWRQLARGRLDEAELERRLLSRGLVNRLLGGRARALVRSSWHMFPVGLLFGLGLETASEITLLGLSASAAAGGASLLAALALPVLFAAGMSAFDTCDGLLMTRAYSWAFASPARRLYYNVATTGMTVAVGLFVGTVYLAGLLARTRLGGPVAAYAAIGNHFQLLGLVIVATFVAGWAGAALTWRFGGFEGRYGTERS